MRETKVLLYGNQMDLYLRKLIPKKSLLLRLNVMMLFHGVECSLIDLEEQHSNNKPKQ
jgi:hypothetical protein